MKVSSYRSYHCEILFFNKGFLTVCELIRISYDYQYKYNLLLSFCILSGSMPDQTDISLNTMFKEISTESRLCTDVL